MSLFKHDLGHCTHSTRFIRHTP